MSGNNEIAAGRAGFAVMIVLVLLALALYLYSERAVPPVEPDSETQAVEPRPVRPDPPRPSAPEQDRGPAQETGTGLSDSPAPGADTDEPLDAAGSNAGDVPEPVSLARAGARLRVQLAERLDPGDLELLVSSRLIERLVAIVHSLDGEPLPLRFRPLAHVAGLPRIVASGDGLRLPNDPDPRYERYRVLFDRFDADSLARLFVAHEPAFEAAWQALGETQRRPFRSRLIEVLDHLAAFDSPDQRPRLVRPEVLYEFDDPALEDLSWGRKILVRIGPEHADAVRRKARALARALAAERPLIDTGAALD